MTPGNTSAILDNDPCDQMVTLEQALKYLVQTDTLDGGFYDRAAAVLGISREEAKRRIYYYLYSG